MLFGHVMRLPKMPTIFPFSSGSREACAEETLPISESRAKAVNSTNAGLASLMWLRTKVERHMANIFSSPHSLIVANLRFNFRHRAAGADIA